MSDSDGKFLEVLLNIQAEVQQLSQSLAAHVSTVEKAFPQNDLGHPDYDGHRRDHVTRMDNSKAMDGYKQTVTKNILGAGTTFILLLLALGFVSLLREKLGV